jgi:excisionase family DNA binding protein
MPAMDAYQDFLKARGVTTGTHREAATRGRYVIVDGVTMPIEEAQRLAEAKLDANSAVSPQAPVTPLQVVSPSQAAQTAITASTLFDAIAGGKIRQGVLELEADSASIPPEIPETYEDALRLWQAVPRHIQILVHQMNGRLVDSAPTTDPTREQTIIKILDNEISLDEAAQLLDVCDATVRRMTKAGTLLHRRTVGKHRRFRVSDVMRVFETRLGKSGGQDDLS